MKKKKDNSVRVQKSKNNSSEKNDSNNKNIHENKDFKSFYIKNYKKFTVIPIILFLISIFFIVKTINVDGTPIYRDISLKGGLSAIVQVDSDKSLDEVINSFKNDFPENSFAISEVFEDGIRKGFIIDSDIDEEVFKEYIKEYFGIEFVYGENYTSNFISPSLSSSFFKQAVYVLILSLILMSIVIFWYFRLLVPSLAVIISAIFDIIVTVGVLDLLEFKISIAGIGALLMLIGYSIDTDILLTNRLVKEKEDLTVFEKVGSAFKTGILMSITTLIAGISALVLTYNISEVIFEISLIMVIGLLVDVISTWIQNTAILLWWIEKKEK